MNWVEFYKKTGNYTVYWFATGKPPGLSELIGRAINKNQGEIIKVIKHSNPLYRHTRKYAEECLK